MGQSRVPGRISEAMMAQRSLRRARENADKEMLAHAKHCHQCTQAISITGNYCDTGWPLAKVRARAIYNWNNRATITAARPQSGQLF